MKKYYQGQYVEMTAEEVAELEKGAQEMAESLPKTVEDELAEIKGSVNKLVEMLTPLIKHLGI